MPETNNLTDHGLLLAAEAFGKQLGIGLLLSVLLYMSCRGFFPLRVTVTIETAPEVKQHVVQH